MANCPTAGKFETETVPATLAVPVIDTAPTIAPVLHAVILASIEVVSPAIIVS